MPKFCNISPAKCANCSDMTVNCCHLYNILTPDSTTQSVWQWASLDVEGVAPIAMMFHEVSIALHICPQLNQDIVVEGSGFLECLHPTVDHYWLHASTQYTEQETCMLLFNLSLDSPLLTTSCLSSRADPSTDLALTTSSRSRPKFLKQFPGISQELGSIKHDHYCSSCFPIY